MKYVYLLRSGKEHYKVGVASSVTKRVNNIQTSNPNPVEIVSTVIVDDAYSLEGEIHTKLKSLKSGGGTEWFQLTAEQALEIAILMHKAPELDVSTRVTLNNQLVEQRLRHKSIEKKIDLLLGIHKKPRVLAKIDSHKEELEEPEEPTKAPRKTVDDEELMLKALDIFRQKGKASTSLLQRSLSIGYGRAARIMDKLEQSGYISELEGSHPRQLIKAVAAEDQVDVDHEK